MTETWQERFLKDPETLRTEPHGARAKPASTADIRRNVAQLLGDSIETMDAMIRYSDAMQPRFTALLETGLNWKELDSFGDRLLEISELYDQLLEARPLHRLINGVNTPNVAYNAAMNHADQICDNATGLCSKVLAMHHAAEALKQRIALETGYLTQPQKTAIQDFTDQLQRLDVEPHNEAHALAAAVLLADHDMRALDEKAKKKR